MISVANEGQALEGTVDGAEATVRLAPTSDEGRDDVTGAPDRQKLFSNVNDGTCFSMADDNDAYVQLKPGYRHGHHMVGYFRDPGPEGTVAKVEVRYRAMRTGAPGTIQVELFEGPRKVGQGPVHALGRSWQNVIDSFDGLSVDDAAQLQTRVRLESPSSSGGLRYTQIWLNVTPQPPSGQRPRRVDAFLLRGISTCVIGNRCVSEPCLALSNDAGTGQVRFADDIAFRGVPPDDPAIRTAGAVQCLRLTLTDAQVAAQRAELERFRDDVALWSGGALGLAMDLRIHEIPLVEMSLSRSGNGLWVSPGNLEPVALPLLSRDTDFTIVTSAIRDPASGLHFDARACGVTFGANRGLAGAGYSWVPDTGGLFGLRCTDHGVYTREWWHQLHFAVHALSSFDDLYGGGTAPCGQGDPNTRRWLPDAQECGRDPDFPACGQGSCGTIDAVNEHLLRAHWPPRGVDALIGNHCRNGVQDFGESGVDTGESCP